MFRIQPYMKMKRIHGKIRIRKDSSFQSALNLVESKMRNEEVVVNVKI